MAAERPLEQQLDPATGFLGGEQTRRDHARVVEDQQIPGRDELRQLAHLSVRERAARAVECQQPAPRAFGERLLSDEMGG